MSNSEIGELVFLGSAGTHASMCDEPNCGDCADPGTGSENCNCEDT